MAWIAGNLTQAAGALHNDGFGTFEYGIDYTAAAAGSNPFFNIADLHYQRRPRPDIGQSSLNYRLVAVLMRSSGWTSSVGTTGKTGLVDCCVGQPTPFSAVPGPIAGAGIPGSDRSLLRHVRAADWRRRRKTLGLA